MSLWSKITHFVHGAAVKVSSPKPCPEVYVVLSEDWEAIDLAEHGADQIQRLDAGVCCSLEQE